jgi:cell division protein FtsN
MRKSYATNIKRRKVVVKNASILASIGFVRMIKLFFMGLVFGSAITLIAVVYLFKLDIGSEIAKIDFTTFTNKSIEPAPKVKKAVVKDATTNNNDEDVKFEFYNILQSNKSSDSHTKDYMLKNDYFLKIASLQSEEDANILQQKLETKNYHVSIKSVVIEGVSWWRVYVGPFKTMRETYDIQNNLRADEIDSILVKGSI